MLSRFFGKFNEGLEISMYISFKNITLNDIKVLKDFIKVSNGRYLTFTIEKNKAELKLNKKDDIEKYLTQIEKEFYY